MFLHFAERDMWLQHSRMHDEGENNPINFIFHIIRTRFIKKEFYQNESHSASFTAK